MNFAGTFKISTPSDTEIQISRDFAAPRELVFDAFTRPELLKRWLSGPPGWSFVVCEVDLRVGGAYRFVWRGPDGMEMGLGGVHREIARPERVVNTQLYDQDWTGGEAVGTLQLTGKNGVTHSTNTVRYQSKEARDGALASGMDQGMVAGYNRLEELLPALQAEDAS